MIGNLAQFNVGIFDFSTFWKNKCRRVIFKNDPGRFGNVSIISSLFSLKPICIIL